MGISEIFVVGDYESVERGTWDEKWRRFDSLET